MPVHHFLSQEEEDEEEEESDGGVADPEDSDAANVPHLVQWCGNDVTMVYRYAVRCVWVKTQNEAPGSTMKRQCAHKSGPFWYWRILVKVVNYRLSQSLEFGTPSPNVLHSHWP